MAFLKVKNRAFSSLASDEIAVDINAIGNTTPGNGLDVILIFQLS